MSPLVCLNSESKYTVALGLQQFIGQKYLVECIGLTGLKG